MSMIREDTKLRRAAPLKTPSDLGADATRDLSAALNILLADLFALYVKTKNFHWHISGPHFRDYHLLLDEQADQIFAITDTVADNASSGLFVLGDRRVPLSEFAPLEVTMSLAKDGVLVSSGDGATCLGDPLNALVWVARMAASFGAPLRAGDVVLSGALGAMVMVEPGNEITAELSVLGAVSVTFSK